MREHLWFEEQIPFYVNGQLSAGEKEEVALHLRECSACREDLALWQAVSEEVTSLDQEWSVPQGLAEKAILHSHRTFPVWGILQHAFQLLKYQAPLVRQDMWPASIGLMLIGAAVAVLSERANFIYFLAPTIAAATLTLIYGPENDPASELTCTTSTPPALVLFARLTLVSAFNLALGLIASLTVAVLLPSVSFWALVLTWLAPMAFLSMLALFLSLWMGAGNGVTIAYALWVIQFIPLRQAHFFMNLPAWAQKVTVLQTFWQNSEVLLIGTLCLLVLSLACAHFSALSFTHRSA